MKTRWYSNSLIRVLAHVAVWAVVLSLPYLLDSHHGIHHHENDGLERKFLYLNLLTNFLWIGAFYLNAYLLAPRFFTPRRYLAYTVSLALLFGVILAIHYCIFRWVFLLTDFSPKAATGFLLPTFILTIAVSTIFRVVRDNMEADQRAKEKQEENLKTELSFLRSQINPHFIFNILNNLVALEQMQSPELGPTILKLSALMQYMLYETDEERVSLNKEVDYLQSYIDLQKQRFGEKVPITVSLEASSPEISSLALSSSELTSPAPTTTSLPSFYEIEPMLLIPFVENAFKHGVGMIADPAIDIRLSVVDGKLQFSVRNRYNPASAEIRDKTSGIGLGNVSRRLKLLYGDQHVLHISRDGAWFTVTLELNLH